MTHRGVVPWMYEDDPEVRDALAGQVLGEMRSLLQHPGWKRLVQTIDQKVTAGRDSMERTGQNIDLSRGAIKALREIRAMPEFAMERADLELARLRGE